MESIISRKINIISFLKVSSILQKKKIKSKYELFAGSLSVRDDFIA